MDARETKAYEAAVRDVIGMSALILNRGRTGYEEFDRWLAAHDDEVRAAAGAPSDVSKGENP